MQGAYATVPYSDLSMIMEQKTENLANGIVENAVNSLKTTPKRRQRIPLPSPIQSNDSRNEIEIKVRVSTTPQSVSSAGFELYTPFVLSPESDEIYIKITKNKIVSLATGNKFSTACTGYKISL